MSTDFISNIHLPDEAKTVVEVLKSFLRFALKLSIIPVLLAIGLGFYFHKKEKEKDITYTARISFIQTNKLNNSLSSGGISNITIPNGVRTGGGGESLLEGIIRSDAVINSAIFRPISSENDEMLANLYLRTYYPEQFDELKFGISDIDSLSAAQKRIYIRIRNTLSSSSSGVLKVSPTGILSLTATTIDEHLSFALVNNIFDATSEFYRQNDALTYSETLENLQHKRDSLYIILKNYEAQHAMNAKTSGFQKDPVQALPDKNLADKIMLLSGQYQDMYAQVESYKMRKGVKQEVFQKLSYPMLPLPKTSNMVFQQTVFGAIIGLFAGMFLIVFIYIIIIGRKLYQNMYR